MEKNADRARRLVGGFFLAVAALMLAAGETVLSARLRQSPGLTLLYWAVCFVSVFLAILVALLDLWIVRRRSREETRGLLRETLEQIAREKQSRCQGDEREKNSD